MALRQNGFCPNPTAADDDIDIADIETEPNVRDLEAVARRVLAMRRDVRTLSHLADAYDLGRAVVEDVARKCLRSIAS